MYNVQVINRVGWDGFIRAPDPTELGWKDTVRISPLEDTIVALRPVAVTVPFQVPDQVRALDPIKPLGEPLDAPPGGLWFSQSGNPVLMPNGVEGIENHLVNYGWEYVWHCHILAHEEMDMMHSQAVLVNAPGGTPNGLLSGEVHNATTNTTAVFLAWQDQSTNETDWVIQRTNVTTTNWTDLKKVPSYSTHQTGVWAMAFDGSIPANTTVNYTYRVFAANVVGDDYNYTEQVDPGELPGFPYMMLNSTASTANVSQAIAPPAQPTFTNTTPRIGFVPLNVTFSTTAGTATGWDWDFGDGNFAADNGKQNPSHVFELLGTYTVTLKAMNTGGNSTLSAPMTVIVSAVPQPAAPTASFTI
jgi:PKD repeat protein